MKKETKAFRAKVNEEKIKLLEEELRLANKLIKEKESIKLLTPESRKIWVDYNLRAAEQTVTMGMFLKNKFPGEDKPSSEMACWRRLVDGLRFFWQAQRIEENKLKRKAIVSRMLTVMREVQKGLSEAIKQLEEEMEKLRDNS